MHQTLRAKTQDYLFIIGSQNKTEKAALRVTKPTIL